MSREDFRGLKPFASIVIIIAALFAIVFCKMEVRRLGYLVWRQSRQVKSLVDERRLLEIRYARTLSPEKVQNYAVRELTLSEPGKGQVIQMAGEQIAFRQ